MTTLRLDPFQETRGVKDNLYGGPVWYQDPEKEDLDVEVGEVVLDIVNNTKKLQDIQVQDILIDGEIEQTMDGASTLTLTLHDPEGELLRSGSFDRAIDLEIDNIWYRLVALTKRDEYLDLVFEDRVIAWLKKLNKVKRSSRAKLTRLEFCLSLIRTSKKKIRVVCPELHVKREIEATEEEKEIVKARTSGGLNLKEDQGIFTGERGPQGLPGPGSRRKIGTKSIDKTRTVLSGERGPQGLPGPGERRNLGKRPLITVKGVKANASQIRVLEEVLRTGADMNISEKMMLAAIMVVIQESLAGQTNVSVSGRHVGPFHQEKGDTIWARRGGALPGNSNKTVRGEMKAFVLRARELDNRDMSAADLAEAVQVAGTPDAWGAHHAEAKRILAAFSLDPKDWGGTVTRTYRKRYSFTTEDQGKAQNYWEAIKRLLDEVEFACFTSNGILYMISEIQLMKAKKQMIFTPRTPGINDIDFTLDSDQEESTVTVTARITRWVAPPGTVVELKECGPVDGRWLVSSIRRSLFSRDAEITLRRPTVPLPEPAPEIGTKTSKAGEPVDPDNLASGDLYDICKHISDQGRSYSQATTRVFSQQRVSDPLDCSNSCALALHRAGMYSQGSAQVSGWFASNWGKPGRGKEFTVWANAGHMFIMSEGNGRKWRFDTGGPGGGEGPRVRMQHRPTGGFTPRHWSGR